MRKTGSILLSIIMTLSLLTGAFSGIVTAEGSLTVAGTAEEIRITPEEADFGTLSTENGKYADERITITVTNIYSKSVRFGFLKDKTNMAHFSLLGLGENEKVSLAKGESVSFAVKPKDGLAAGTYKETLEFEFNGEDFYSTAAYSLKMVLAEDAKYIKVVSDPLQFDLTEGYDAANSAKQVTLKNTSTGALRFDSCTVSTDDFTVNTITTTGGSLAAGGTASFRVIPKDGMKYDTNAHSGKLVFKYADALGGSQTKVIDFDWRVNAEYAEDITVSPAAIVLGTLQEGYSAPAAKTVKITNANEDFKVSVLRPYSRYLTTSELVCGSEKLADKSDVVFNKPVTFTVAPVTGRKAGTYEDKLDIKLLDENGNASVKTVTVSYTVEGKKKQYHTAQIESSKGAMKIDNTGDLYSKASVLEGDKVILTAPSDKTSVFKEWNVTSGSLKLDCPYSANTSFIMGSEDVTIKAVYEDPAEGSHSIIVKSNDGGSAWTETPIAKKDDHVYVHAKPDDGYHFVKYTVTINEKVVSETEGYNEIDFDLPDADVEVEAVFEADPCRLTLTHEGLGKTDAGKYTGQEGDTVYIAASPETGYKFKEWKVTAGGAVIADPTAQNTKLTFGKGNTEVEAIFVKREYNVNITTKGNGKAVAEPTYLEGRYLVTAYPDEGYKLKKFTVYLPNETKEITDSTFYLTCGSAETIDVTAEFEKAPAVTTTTTTDGDTTTTTTTTSVSGTTVSKETTTKATTIHTTNTWIDGVLIYDVDCSLSDRTVKKGAKTVSMDLTYEKFGVQRLDKKTRALVDEMEVKLTLPKGMTLVKAVDGNGEEYTINADGTFTAHDCKAVLTIGLPSTIKAGSYEVKANIHHSTSYRKSDNKGNYFYGGTAWEGNATGTITVTDGKVTTSVTTDSSKTSKTTVSKTTTTTTTSKTAPTEDIKVVYGDADVNERVDLADVTYLAKHLLSPVSNPLGDADKGTIERAKRSADVNGDGIVDILDLSRLIEYNLGKLMITDLDPRTRK